MSEAPKREHGRAPVAGIVLVFLGVVFLLETLGVLPWGLWGTLWQFWPVVLIVLGVSIIMRGLNPWLVSLVIIVLLFASVAFAHYQYLHNYPAPV